MIRIDLRRYLAVLVVFLGLSSLAQADDLDNYVTSQMRRLHTPGLSMAVVRAGNVVKAEGYGLASIELGAPATTATVFRIGSLTRQFTSTLILMEMEGGKLRLADPISKYLDKSPASWSKITILELLNNTSGIKDYASLGTFGADSLRPVTTGDFVRTVAKYPLEFPAGTGFEISNTGYFLLGMVLERASGRPYADLLHEKIFGPLNMSSTRLDDPSAIFPNRAAGYAYVGGTIHNARYVDMSWMYAAGGLVSTVGDLAKWDAALYSETLLKAADRDLMWTSDGGSRGGFGWEMTAEHGHRAMAHTGVISGFTSYIARFVDDRTTVIVLTNSQDSNPGAIARGVLGFYIPGVSTAAEKPITDAEPQVTALLRDIVTKFASATGDPNVFTPEMWKLVQPSIQNPDAYKSLGELQAVDVLDRQTVPELSLTTYKYRLTYAKQILIVDLVLDKAGKVTAMKVRPE